MVIRARAGGGPPVSRPVVSRPAGQQLARTELSKAIYHPHVPLPQRLFHLLGRLLTGLYDAGKSFPGGWWAVVALAALTALAVTLVLARLGRLAGEQRTPGPRLPGGQPLSAADHRRRATGLARAGDHAGAILETVRAITRELEERGMLSPRLGRTADEIAAEAGQRLPGDAAALRDAARLFDDICYGERPGTGAGYAWVRALDARIQSARPSQPSTGDAA
ncbi:MAG TPA: DUF4129 domain-containing protein [Streptosporangiaceae bacterium]|nr:DUF4129 domain-containing protein [Streptosporangiaceae bacterium]